MKQHFFSCFSSHFSTRKNSPLFQKSWRTLRTWQFPTKEEKNYGGGGRKARSLCVLPFKCSAHLGLAEGKTIRMRKLKYSYPAWLIWVMNSPSPSHFGARSLEEKAQISPSPPRVCDKKPHLSCLEQNTWRFRTWQKLVAESSHTVFIRLWTDFFFFFSTS